MKFFNWAYEKGDIRFFYQQGIFHHDSNIWKFLTEYMQKGDMKKRERYVFFNQVFCGSKWGRPGHTVYYLLITAFSSNHHVTLYPDTALLQVWNNWEIGVKTNNYISELVCPSCDTHSFILVLLIISIKSCNKLCVGNISRVRGWHTVNTKSN